MSLQPGCDKENVSVNQALLGRCSSKDREHAEADSGADCQADSLTIQHSFVAAVLAALNTTEVRIFCKASATAHTCCFLGDVPSLLR